MDEKKLKAITLELSDAAKSKDASVLDKYLYPGSKIVIDMGPAKNREKGKSVLMNTWS